LKLPDIGNMSAATDSRYVAFYWGGQMIGRFLGAVSLCTMKNKRLKYLIMGLSYSPLSLSFVY